MRPSDIELNKSYRGGRRNRVRHVEMICLHGPVWVHWSSDGSWGFTSLKAFAAWATEELTDEENHAC